MAAMIYRRLKATELPQAVRLWKDYMLEAEAGGSHELATPANLRWYGNKLFAQVVGFEQGAALVAEAPDGALVGLFLAAETVLRTEHGLGRVAENMGIYVVPQERTNGVAHGLRAEALKQLKADGFDTYLTSYKPPQPTVDEAGAKMLQITTVVSLKEL